MAEHRWTPGQPPAPGVTPGGDRGPDPHSRRPADLTPEELIDLLDAAFRQDQGEGVKGPDPATRAALADYLGCHEEVRATVWERWRRRLEHDPSADLGHAEYWLDAEFVEPCPR